MKSFRIAILFVFYFIVGCAGQHAQTSALSSTVSSPQPSTPDLSGGPEGEIRSQKVSEQLAGTGSTADKAVYLFGPSTGKRVALTFDDGPDNKYTPKILDILKKNDVKATFFIIGSRAKAYPDIVKRMVSDGHVIGNHSWDHPDFVKISTDEVVKQVNDTQKELQSIIGYRPSLFRPPYGSLNRNDVKAIAGLGLNIVDWSVDTRDWAGTPTPNIMKTISKELKPGGIILQHCAGGKHGSLGNTVTALNQLIPELKKQGYTFVTVPELLSVPASLS